MPAGMTIVANLNFLHILFYVWVFINKKVENCSFPTGFSVIRYG